MIEGPNAPRLATAVRKVHSAANPSGGGALFVRSVADQMTARPSIKHPIVAGFHAWTNIGSNRPMLPEVAARRSTTLLVNHLIVRRECTISSARPLIPKIQFNGIGGSLT
jgi:hypothetical protein